jgi:hypothetical protein
MNVLSQFIYTALRPQGVTSSEALADPYDKKITLSGDFVNISILAGLIDDPHFVTRDRMGRDLAFLCRVYNNGWSTAPDPGMPRTWTRRRRMDSCSRLKSLATL